MQPHAAVMERRNKITANKTIKKETSKSQAATLVRRPNFALQCNILSQQVGWLDVRGGHLHFEGQGITPHEWCYVWSTMVS
jgi:hypothetical protein